MTGAAAGHGSRAGKPQLARAAVDEVIEAHVLRQVALGGALSPQFARHVVDDLVIPVLAGYQKGERDVARIAGYADA